MFISVSRGWVEGHAKGIGYVFIHFESNTHLNFDLNQSRKKYKKKITYNLDHSDTHSVANRRNNI